MCWNCPRLRVGTNLQVFQDFLTKWPMVFPAPGQQSICIVRLLADEVVPLFGVPEALLSDRGTNLLSYLMKDVCSCLGIKKLKTTAYHPQCDGMVERFNRTLIAILKKHVEKFGMQWDKHIPGIMWAYISSVHLEKSHLIFYLALTAGHPQRHHCYQPHLIVKSTLLTTLRTDIVIETC